MTSSRLELQRLFERDPAEAFARVQAELEASEKELDNLAHSVSHDLRAPLRAVLGFGRVLARGHAEQMSPEARRLLERVLGAGQTMERLIDALLRFARLSRQPLVPAPVPMTALVEEVLARLRAAEPERSVDVRVAELPAAVGDRGLLLELWTQLLSNAFKFTRSTERAQVEVAHRDDDASGPAYWVRDNGAGFDMRYATRLFELFQRMHRAEDFEGDGAGLALAQRIVARHGGRLWAEATPDQGATFYFSIVELEGAASHPPDPPAERRE